MVVAEVLAFGGAGDTVFGEFGGFVEASTGYVLGYYEIEIPPAASAAALLVETDLTLPADALLQAAHFAVAASPASGDDPATISSVASVRAATALNSGHVACTVDFGRLVTVGGITSSSIVSIGPSIDAVYRWTGSAWSFISGSTAFAESATERLLLESDTSGVSGEELAGFVAALGVSLPAVPASLELLVGGTTVWFERQGSSPITVAGAPDGESTFLIDRTDAVREALARAPATAATKTVRVGLRAGNPGRLALTPSIAALRVFTVPFAPDGVVRSVDFTEEGAIDFDVTPPSAADVREVAGVVRGSFGPERVQPAIGPDLVADAHLVLAPARPVLLGLPDSLTSKFGKLTGVRLVLRADAETNGGQVTGRLLADAGGAPGDPLPGGDLAAVTVGPGDERFWTLTFAEAIDPPVLGAQADPAVPRIASWLELQLAHGSVECAFTAADPNDPVAPGAPVLRRLPGGGTAELSDIPSLGPLRAAIRVVGTADRDRPIAAVTLGVQGAADSIGVTPTADDLAARLTLATPLGVSAPVLLSAVAAAAGTLTLDTVQVTYREVGS